MRKITYLLFAATIMIASCKKDKEPTPTPTPTPETPTAKVKFVNGCVNSGTLGVRINDTNATAVSAQAFLSYTGYVNTSYGNNTGLAFWYPNTSLVLADTTYNLAANSYYSAYVGGFTPGDAPFIITDDNLNAPASGKAKVRFINLANENFDIDFFVGGPALDSNISYKRFTPFYEVTAGAKNVVVGDPFQFGYSITLTGFQFDAGKIYTFMLTGLKTGTGDASLKVTVINNN